MKEETDTKVHITDGAWGLDVELYADEEYLKFEGDVYFIVSWEQVKLAANRAGMAIEVRTE